LHSDQTRTDELAPMAIVGFSNIIWMKLKNVNVIETQ